MSKLMKWMILFLFVISAILYGVSWHKSKAGATKESDNIYYVALAVQIVGILGLLYRRLY